MVDLEVDVPLCRATLFGPSQTSVKATGRIEESIHGMITTIDNTVKSSVDSTS